MGFTTLKPSLKPREDNCVLHSQVVGYFSTEKVIDINKRHSSLSCLYVQINIDELFMSYRIKQSLLDYRTELVFVDYPIGNSLRSEMLPLLNFSWRFLFYLGAFWYGFFVLIEVRLACNLNYLC